MITLPTAHDNIMAGTCQEALDRGGAMRRLGVITWVSGAKQ